MEISIKAQSAVALMAELAHAQGKGPLTLASVSIRLGLSISYLENVARVLRLAGMIRATKGPGGGYQLARSAQEVSVGDILRVVGSMEPVETDLSAEDVSEPERQVTDDLLARYLIERQMFLDRRSLQSLLPRVPSSPPASRHAFVPRVELEETV